MYTFYANLQHSSMFGNFLENPGPKTIYARGLELLEAIISGYQSQPISSITYIKYQYQSQDINPNENDQTMRFRKKIEKDER